MLSPFRGHGEWIYIDELRRFGLIEMMATGVRLLLSWSLFAGAASRWATPIRFRRCLCRRAAPLPFRRAPRERFCILRCFCCYKYNEARLKVRAKSLAFTYATRWLFIFRFCIFISIWRKALSGIASAMLQRNASISMQFLTKKYMRESCCRLYACYLPSKQSLYKASLVSTYLPPQLHFTSSYLGCLKRVSLWWYCIDRRRRLIIGHSMRIRGVRLIRWWFIFAIYLIL